MSSINVPATPVLRFARPTTSLATALHFYQTALGLELVESFDNHRGFDGRILSPRSPIPGSPAPWHLEFTFQHGEKESCRAPTKDNLLALYLNNKAEVEQRKARMIEHGYHPVESLNPYWDDNGVTFEDPEGWRIVLSWLEWTL